MTEEDSAQRKQYFTLPKCHGRTPKQKAYTLRKIYISSHIYSLSVESGLYSVTVTVIVPSAISGGAAHVIFFGHPCAHFAHVKKRLSAPFHVKTVKE